MYLFSFSFGSDQVLGVWPLVGLFPHVFSARPAGVLQERGSIPFKSSHLLEATALSGNYYFGDKYGDKTVLACKMYEVSGRWERCTWPGNEWCEGTSAAHEPPFSSSPCLVSSSARTSQSGDSCIFLSLFLFYLVFSLKHQYSLHCSTKAVRERIKIIVWEGGLNLKKPSLLPVISQNNTTVSVQLDSTLITKRREFKMLSHNLSNYP